jgi:hypothetical protein
MDGRLVGFATASKHFGVGLKHGQDPNGSGMPRPCVRTDQVVFRAFESY